MNRILVLIGICAVIFAAWLLLGSWALLTPFDLSVVFGQSILSLASISVSVVSIVGQSRSTRSLIWRVPLSIASGYILWVLVWYVTMFLVVMLASASALQDKLNNSQAFISSFAIDPTLPLVLSACSIVAIWMMNKQPL